MTRETAALIDGFKIRASALVIEVGQQYAESGKTPEEIAQFQRDLSGEVMLASAWMHRDQQRSADDFRKTAEHVIAIAWESP